MFIRAAYQRVLDREADEEGVLNYMGALSRGVEKESILVSLMNSKEAQRLNNGNEVDVASASSDRLSTELAQLNEAHNKNRFLKRVFSGQRRWARRKDLNALEFRIESMFLSMLGQLQIETSDEIASRLSLHDNIGKHPEISRPAQSNLHRIKVIQAQRRSVSRPGGQD